MKTYTYESSFGGTYEVTLSFEKYAYGGTALILNSTDEYGGDEIFLVASVFVEGFTPDLPANRILVKDYSENEGVLDWLQSNGIVSEVLGVVSSPYVDFPLVEILIDFEIDE